MNKKDKPWYLKKRKPVPPPKQVHEDRKKEARRTVARGSVPEEEVKKVENRKSGADAIRVGGRVGFNKIEEIHERFRDVDFPIELALPWRYELWKQVEPKFDEMLECLDSLDFEVLSVHATQGWISKDTFLSWGPKTCQLADRFGGRAITVHPNRAKKPRETHQDMTRRNIKKVQRETSVTVSVETFGGKKRVLTPQEIMDFGLPMTLDTSHIREDKRIIDIIESYWQNIPVIHLSARNAREQHLPIDRFCLDVVEYLLQLGWTGNIVLEYLPQYRERLRPDIKKVRDVLA